MEEFQNNADFDDQETRALLDEASNEAQMEAASSGIPDINPHELEEDEHKKLREDFNANLVYLMLDELGEGEVKRFGSEILEAVEKDEEHRSQWEETLKSGLELCNLSEERVSTHSIEELSSSPFEGASKAYSSKFLLAALNFVALARTILLPTDKMCKIKSFGNETEEEKDISERMELYYDYYIYRECKEFKAELEKAMLWAALAGNGYIKVIPDARTNLPSIEMISPFNIVVPETAKTLETSPRVTHIMYLSQKDLSIRMNQGIYRKVDLNTPDDLEDGPGNDLTQSHENDELSPSYKVIEIHIDISLPSNRDERRNNSKEVWKDTPRPYIITIEASSGEVLAVRRNWEQDDELMKKKEYFARFPFLPGVSFHNLGLAHVAAGPTIGATKLQRQLIDLSTLQNNPGGFRTKGTIRGGHNDFDIDPLKFNSIDTSQHNSVRDAFQRFEYPSPSPVTYQMKQDLEETVMELGTLVSFTPENLPANMPATSMLAAIENATQPQNAVIQRFYKGMSEIFEIMFRIFRNSLPDEPFYFMRNEKAYISRNDFAIDMNVIPTADPNASSKLQRLLRWQAVFDLASQNPDLHNWKVIYENMYKDMGIQNVDQILVQEPEVVPLDPVTENYNMMLGQPAKVGEAQDDDAHMAVHQLILMDPNVAEDKKAIAMAHVGEHQASKMRKQILMTAGIQLPPQEGDQPQQLDPEMENQIAMAAAQASQQLQEQLQQQMAQAQGQNPEDPNGAMAQALMQKNELDAQHQQQKLIFDTEKLRVETEKLRRADIKDQREFEIKMKEFELDKIDLLKRETQDDESKDLDLYKIVLDYQSKMGTYPPSLAEVMSNIDPEDYKRKIDEGEILEAVQNQEFPEEEQSELSEEYQDLPPIEEGQAEIPSSNLEEVDNEELPVNYEQGQIEN